MNYEPLTEIEFTELTKVLNEIGAYLPDNQRGDIWSNFHRVRNANEQHITFQRSKSSQRI